MSSRSLAAVLLVVAGVSAALALSLALGLPLLAALPLREQEPPPLWTYLGPAAAWLAVAVLAWARARGAGHSAERLANLPGQIVLLFAAVAVLAILVGARLEPHALVAERPAAIYVAAPCLVLAWALVLRFLVQPPIMRELARLFGGGSQLEGAGWFGSLGVLALRSTLTVATVVLAAATVALLGVHVHARSRAERREAQDRQLADLVEVVRAQLGQLAPGSPARGGDGRRGRPTTERRLAEFLAGYPASALGVPAALDAGGRALAPAAGIRRGERIVVAGRECASDRRRYRCAAGPADELPRVLAILPAGEPDDSALALSNDLLLIGLGLVAFAGILGWGIGVDTSRDFRAMTAQLRAMARADDVDLGRPIPVTSIDEVGALTAALGKLRHRLDAELDEYRTSLRKVREADRVKNRFFADVSHELRTPLTTICGYAQLAVEGIVPGFSAAQRDDIRIVHQSACQLLSLVNDVLDIAVIESGHLTLNLESVDVVALCREVARGQAAVARKKADDSGLPLELSVEAAEAVPWIVADPGRLRQVMQNLLSNAIKFTRRGSVVVRIARRDEAVEIAVADTGVGISAAELPLLFERYRQVGAMQARRQGSGLGLGICKHLVEQHDGAISVESELDRGSTFTVVLPLRGPWRASGAYRAASRGGAAG